MNTKQSQIFTKAIGDVESATVELSQALAEYEKRVKAAQSKLNLALAALHALNALGGGE